MKVYRANLGVLLTLTTSYMGTNCLICVRMSLSSLARAALTPPDSPPAASSSAGRINCTQNTRQQRDDDG